MTKDTYLNQLKLELRGLPYDDITDILAEISAHFDEGMTNGQTEDEIANKLGAPKRLGFEYLIDTPKNKTDFLIKNRPLTTLAKFTRLGFARLIGLPLAIATIAIVFSLYIVIYSGYFTGFMFILSPILKMAFPHSVNTGGMSPWLLSIIGFAVIIGSHYILIIYNRVVMSIYRYAIKKPLMRNL